MKVMVVVVAEAVSPTNKKLPDYNLTWFFDVKSGLDWRLVHFVNRAGDLDVFWKLSKTPKKINNSKLRFLKTIKVDESR